MEFRRVLDTLAGFFEREGVRFAVVGAFGLAAYGQARATADLDVATEAGVRARLVGFLESLGHETLHVSEGYSSHLHPDPVLGRVDVVYVGGAPRSACWTAPVRSSRSGRERFPSPGPSTWSP